MRDPLGERTPRVLAAALLSVALIVAVALLATLLLRHLGHPLLWHDEADTIAFAQRVIRYGYPRLEGEPSLLYAARADRVGAGGAYLGGSWLPYYVGAIGVAFSEGVEDLHARTARMRLPFAAIGLAGILLLAAALAPAVDGGMARRGIFALLYLLACAPSISLILHLRQARYYALVVCLFACIAALFVRHHVLGRLSYAGYATGTSLLLFALFNAFHPAFASAVIALGTHAVARAARSPGALRTRLRQLLRDALPILVSAAGAAAVAVATALWVQIGADLADTTGSARSFGQNLAFVTQNMLRYELLAPALLAHAAAVALSRARSGTVLAAALRRRRAASGFFLWLVLVHTLLVCCMPLVWERYLVALSPLVTAAVLIDGAALIDLARERAAPRLSRRGALAALAALAATLGALGWLRGPETRGLLEELRTPVRGPLDDVIAYLKQRYPDPSHLVIATNYEGPVYNVYLGSRVILGFYGGNLEEDLRLEPDVIVPRPWPERRRELRQLEDRGDFERVPFAVRSGRTNNFPSLWPRSPGGVQHQFRTQLAAWAEEQTYLLERSAPD